MKRPTFLTAFFVTLTMLAFVSPTLAADKKEKDTKEKIEYLFVQNSKELGFADGKLTMKNVSPTTIFFSDRPARVAGHLPTHHFVSEWGKGDDNFAENPPNASLSYFDGDDMVDVVVELTKPILKGDELSYEVKMLEGKLPPSAKQVSLFIDVIGRPLTPVSYAGATRRAGRRAYIRRY